MGSRGPVGAMWLLRCSGGVAEAASASASLPRGGITASTFTYDLRAVRGTSLRARESSPRFTGMLEGQAN